MSFKLTPQEVKKLATECDCEVCSTITEHDYYISIPKPSDIGEGRIVIARWGNRPCKSGCGVLVQPGDEVFWEPNWGISHLKCYEGRT